MPKNGLIIFCCIMLAMASVPVRAGVKNPDTFVLANYGTLRTLDPAVCYDATGSQRIWNIYETLVFFDGSSTEKYIPLLAEEVPTLENGGISPDGRIYTFRIRKGIAFHEGGDLSPEDVAYSIKRAMIVDPDGGPMWMLLEALTGSGATRVGATLSNESDKELAPWVGRPSLFAAGGGAFRQISCRISTRYPCPRSESSSAGCAA